MYFSNDTKDVCSFTLDYIRDVIGHDLCLDKFYSWGRTIMNLEGFVTSSLFRTWSYMLGVMAVESLG
jgi:hypothetical protein